MKHIRAGCGLEIKEEENFVCPYLLESRKSDCDPKYGCCQIDCQVGTGVCLYAFDAEILKRVVSQEQRV